MLELHGDLMRTVCSGDRRVVTGWPDAEGPGPPPCPDCGAPLRPDVVWFGEMLPEDALQGAMAAAARCDLMLVVGTSGRVYPAASVVPVALQAGARVVVVDPGDPGWSHPRVEHLRGGAVKVVPELVERMLAG